MLIKMTNVLKCGQLCCCAPYVLSSDTAILQIFGVISLANNFFQIYNDTLCKKQQLTMGDHAIVRRHRKLNSSECSVSTCYRNCNAPKKNCKITVLLVDR